MDNGRSNSIYNYLLNSKTDLPNDIIIKSLTEHCVDIGFNGLPNIDLQIRDYSAYQGEHPIKCRLVRNDNDKDQPIFSSNFGYPLGRTQLTLYPKNQVLPEILRVADLARTTPIVFDDNETINLNFDNAMIAQKTAMEVKDETSQLSCDSASVVQTTPMKMKEDDDEYGDGNIYVTVNVNQM
jgi:hypothetical protein